MSIDKSAIKCLIAQRNTQEEIKSGNLGRVMLFLRGIGQVTLYLKRDRDKKIAFARYQTWVSEETEKRFYFFRYKPSEEMQDIIFDEWKDQMRHGDKIDLSYMDVWSMSEADYLPLGQTSNEKLGILGVQFIPRKEVSNSLIGYMNVNTVYGEILNIRVGINQDKSKKTSFFVIDPSFYDAERNINFSKFKLFPEIKIFLCRLMQYYYNNGSIRFIEEINAPNLEDIFAEGTII